MKRSAYYPKLAAEGIRKNRKLYLPYLITCVCMVMMHYILSFLSYNERVVAMHGGVTLCAILYLGSHVVTLFSLLFLFYTHSFLIRRRQREFGLYNVLGMGKRELARIISWETLYSVVLSLGVGLFLGIVLSKLAELGLARMVGSEVDYVLRVEPAAIKSTITVYASIFLLIWLASLIRVGRSTAVALMKSENVGEKPPKANWLFGLGGVAILGFAYWLAVCTESPVDALIFFFAAVLLVIVATYMLMIAGSVLLCRVLQRNRRYYYNSRHFVSVSSMAYRMKRNGAGLASICILATMVLVMVSSTTCLYAGTEDTMRNRYPRDTMAEVSSYKALTEADTQALKERFFALAEETDTPIENVLSYRSLTVSCALGDDGCLFLQDSDYFSVTGLSAANASVRLYLLPLADYNAVMGSDLTLSDGEAYYYSRMNGCKNESFFIPDGPSWTVKESVDGFESSGDDNAYVLNQFYLVVPDFDAAVEQVLALCGGEESSARVNLCFGVDASGETEGAMNDFIEAMRTELNDLCQDGTIYSYAVTDATDGRADYYGTFGGLFFLGVLLSLVFILAAVLIIYYKQISEGYEDRARYEIMRKVGMTKKEIRRSINSQLLTVFYLPLALAGLHMVFAFPMIQKLLTLFAFYNVKLFVFTTLGSFAVFAVFYALVYRLTSNVYYRIVSAEDRELA